MVKITAEKLKKYYGKNAQKKFPLKFDKARKSFNNNFRTKQPFKYFLIYQKNFNQ